MFAPSVLSITALLLFASTAALQLGSCTLLGTWDELARIMSTDPWFDLDWQKRVKLRLTNSAQSQTLRDFPLLVVLDSTKIDYTDLKADGSDLRFVDAGLTCTQLDYEIENWSYGGFSYIWVGVPAIDGRSNDDYIWLYLDNPSAASAASPADVWDANYVAVWHLNSGYDDSTQYGNDGAPSAVGSVAAAIAGGGSFNGFSSHIEVPDSATLDISGSLTLEAWIYKTVNTDQIVVSKYNKGAAARSYDLGFDRAGHAGRSYLTISSDGSLAMGGLLELTPASAISLNQWHCVAGVYSNSNPADPRLFMYLDGSLDNSESSDQSSVFLSNETVLLGAFWDGAAVSGHWHGYLDELRISNTARSAEWLAAQYLSMSDAFVSFGGAETAEDNPWVR